MQLYKLTYSLQNNKNPKSCLKKFCDDTGSRNEEPIFIKFQSYVGKKVYTITDNGDTVTEALNVNSYYILSSVIVILFAIEFLLTGFELNSIDLVWYAFLVLGTIGVLITPYWMMSHQPSAFYPDDQSPFGLTRFKLLPFQQQTEMSPVVYLTTLAAGIVLLPVVFPDPNVLAAIFPVSVFSVFLAWQDGFDPASDTITVITVLTLLPFAIPLINLGMYTQWNITAGQNMELLQNLTPDAFDQINQAITLIAQSETFWLIATNLTTIVTLFFVMKLINEGADRIEVYKPPHSIKDKKHLRAGVAILFITYVGGSISLLLSQLLGHPIVPVDTVFDGLLIYWPLFVLVPIWFVVWYWDLSGDTVDAPVDVSEAAFEVGGIPVLFRDLGGTAAFPVLDDEPVIVLHEQLRKDLIKDEIQAVCYHELYHVKHNSVKYQKWIDVPVVGYLLFLFRTDLSELYNEEYAADEFAATKVGTEAVVSTLTTVNSMELGRSGSPIQSHVNEGWRGIAQLLFSPPILSLYSPPRHHRIKRLQEDTTST